MVFIYLTSYLCTKELLLGAFSRENLQKKETYLSEVTCSGLWLPTLPLNTTDTYYKYIYVCTVTYILV